VNIILLNGLDSITPAHTQNAMTFENAMGNTTIFGWDLSDQYNLYVEVEKRPAQD
jgi:hypothetical protein